ncbi:LXG domain-containing protein [Bacillus sp. FJAT-47783]|uniref:ribonuclease YeeF family protein n=1 Tax=Bacillus sp. FJAT-47783 TaxID=2922712 RepID=UPI001FAE3A46|nr:LXG domain-containing protein [Bacillus sp. FJAT-47783]
MKVLDSQSLHNSIEDVLNKIKSQMNHLKELEKAIELFSELDDAFDGKGGKAIRSFYQDWHKPLLSFYYYSLKSYEGALTKLKEASEDLEPNSNGYIRQSFLEGELTNGIDKIKSVTVALVDEANGAIESVNDIVTLQNLNDSQFHSHTQRANNKIDQTIEKLVTFDTTQTKELDTVEYDITLMKRYINEVQGMFKSGELSIENYNSDLLKEKPSFNELEKELIKGKVMMFGDMLTSPFDYINGKMSLGDTVLAGYQTASAGYTYIASRKLQVHYFGSKPTLWQKLRGKYEFTVKIDPSWTSKGKHSAKMAKRLLDFSKAPTPSNPVMRSFQKFVQSYKSPSHLYKHLAGFPKNVDRMTGREFMKGTYTRMATGTKEVVGKVVTKSGFVQVGRRIPGVGTGISLTANAGELFSHENKDKSLSERWGRFVGGVLADAGTIAVGAKVGATIGSVGGPAGVVVGGAVGAFVGGLASSQIGDIAKDIGGKIGKDVGKVAGKINSAITDAGEKLKKSISSWFN